jgi:hypothetical protein
MHKIISLLTATAIVVAPSSAIASVDIPIDFADRGISFPVSRKGATINIKTAKINSIVLSDRSCVVYTQLQNSIYVKALSPCLKLSNNPDHNPVLRVFTEDNLILKFNVCAGCSGAKDLNIVQSKPLEPIAKAPVSLRRNSSSDVLVVPTQSFPPPSPVTSTVPLPPPVELPSKAFPLLKPIDSFAPQPVLSSSLPTQSIKKKKRKTPEAPNIVSPLVIPSSTPIPAKKTLAPIPPKLSPLFKLSLNQEQAKALLKGLNKSRVSKGKDRIIFRSKNWMIIQDTIYLLKKGLPLSAAVQKSRASTSLVNKLLSLGGFSD